MARRVSPLRRRLALAMLVGYAASAGEATAGVLRDGAVHHESVAAAAFHQETYRGDHGHEDPGTGAEHGTGHEHGTSGDHCTHAHSMGLPTAYAFGVFGDVVVTEVPTGQHFGDAASGFHFRPPKA